MIFFFEAIKKAWDGSGYTHKMYSSKAPHDAKKPYITRHLIDDTPFYHFDAPGETGLFQFSVWSDSEYEALEILNDVTHVFDDAVLEYGEGLKEYGCSRRSSQCVQDGEAWHAFVEYEIEVKKA